MGVAPDSSVLIAGFWPTHLEHESAVTALAAVRADGSLIAHTLAETYATLTAGLFSAPASTVLGYLEQFPSARIGLAPVDMPAALSELAAAGIIGGAIYDGLIAIAAREAEVTLVSLDRRARGTYDAIGVDHRSPR